MITLSQIQGQERAIATLRRALALGRVPHAYLFVGPTGCGKHTAGLALAAAMNCDQAPGEGCGECASCSRIGNGLHPDVVTLERQGASQTIPIETIRSQVIPALALPPHEGRARVFLIEEATSLLGPAANALLKTLEEPPARSHFVLATARAAELLPTIKSRCQRVGFQALPLALRAALGGSEPAATDHVATLVAALAAPGRASLYAAAEAVGGDRAALGEALRGLAEWLHQRGRDAAVAGALDHASAASRAAQAVLDTARGVAVHNAHGVLALEALLGALRAQPGVSALAERAG